MGEEEGGRESPPQCRRHRRWFWVGWHHATALHAPNSTHREVGGAKVRGIDWQSL